MVTQEQSEALLRDLIDSQQDVLAVGQHHDLSPHELARWMEKPDNARVMANLCALWDHQTQIIISRYRALAAGRLVRLASEEGQGETARRACIDLLKIQLVPPPQQSEPADEDHRTAELLWRHATAPDNQEP